MTGSPASGVAARKALTWHAGVAVTVCLLAWLALLPAQAGAAQDRSRSPTPEKLWKAYPLDPTAAPSAEPDATSSPAALAGAERQPLAAARPPGDGGAPVIVLALLVLLAAGGAMTFLGSAGVASASRHAADVPRRAHAASSRPALSHGGSGRFTRATARTSGARATAVVASAQGAGGGGARAAMTPEAGPAANPPAGDPSPVAAAAPRGHRPLTAGWRGRRRSNGATATASRASASSPEAPDGDAGGVASARVAAHRARGGAGDDRRRGAARGDARGRRMEAAPARPQLVRQAVRLGAGRGRRPRRSGRRRAGAPAASAGSRCCAC